jgi:hypothetical protein
MKGKGNTEQITPADGEYLLWFSSYLVAPPLSFSVGGTPAARHQRGELSFAPAIVRKAACGGL